MSLSDIMSGADMTTYAQIGLVVSMVTFLGIVIWLFRRPREEMEARARGVFEDGELPFHPQDTPESAPDERRDDS